MLVELAHLIRVHLAVFQLVSHGALARGELLVLVSRDAGECSRRHLRDVVVVLLLLGRTLVGRADTARQAGSEEGLRGGLRGRASRLESRGAVGLGRPLRQDEVAGRGADMRHASTAGRRT